VNRGAVVLVFHQFASGAGGKRRPGLVVQNDADNSRMAATIVAQITTNLARAGESTHLPIEASTAEARTFGLLHDSLVSCNNLITVDLTAWSER
jgi:mRNA interferase MazF